MVPKLFSRILYVVCINLFFLLFFSGSAQAVGCNLSTDPAPANGDEPLTVEISYNASGLDGVWIYLDSGDGDSWTDAGNNNVNGTVSHTYYGGSYTITLECEDDFSGPIFKYKNVNVDGGSGGGNPQCSDGLDNDEDGAIDYPADPGCENAAPDNSEDSEGGWPRYVSLNITTSPANVAWKIACPNSGPYGCSNPPPGGTGTADLPRGAPYNDCNGNGACAGGGWWELIGDDPNYSCTSDGAFRGYDPNGPTVQFDLHIDCSPIGSPTPSTPPSTGSLTVTSNNADVSWNITSNPFVGGPYAGSGVYALYSPVAFGTYTIAVTNPPQYDCVPDASSRTINAANPNGLFSIVCTFNPGPDITPPTTTLANITTPRNTNLGTVSGTASDNVSVAVNGVTIVIRDMTTNQDWNPTLGVWGALGWVISTTMVPNGGPSVNWSYPPSGATLTSGHNYRVFVNAIDTASNTSGWNTYQDFLFDNTPPTGTITAIPNPTNTRLTSAGAPNGTIFGTANDTFTNVTAPLILVIREWNGIGTEGACDVNNRDWNGGGWQGACTIGLTPSINPALPAASVNWVYSSTPTTGQMTLGRRYHIYLQIADGAGNLSNWSPNVSILYELPNVAPTTSDVKATEPDYCLVGPSVTASWRYADSEGTPQSAFQVQVDDDAGFGSPNFDSGKLLGNTTSYYVSSGLVLNTVYQIRVQTWDAGDMASGWTNQTLCTGPGCIGGTSWRTPSIPYPIAAFTNVPTKPIAGQPTQFTDGSSCYGLGICSQWAWDFGDGATDTVQNPSHTFAVQGAYTVRLSVTDPWNQTCSITKNLGVNKAIPFWKEVLPW